jgi:hypothetical protein
VTSTPTWPCGRWQWLVTKSIVIATIRPCPLLNVQPEGQARTSSRRDIGLTWRIPPPGVRFRPFFDWLAPPDTTCSERRLWLGKIGFGLDELVDALPGHAEQFGDFGDSHQLVCHARNLQTDLTIGKDLR